VLLALALQVLLVGVAEEEARVVRVVVELGAAAQLRVLAVGEEEAVEEEEAEEDVVEDVEVSPWFDV